MLVLLFFFIKCWDKEKCEEKFFRFFHKYQSADISYKIFCLFIYLITLGFVYYTSNTQYYYCRENDRSNIYYLNYLKYFSSVLVLYFMWVYTVHSILPHSKLPKNMLSAYINRQALLTKSDHFESHNINHYHVKFINLWILWGVLHSIGPEHR